MASTDRYHAHSRPEMLAFLPDRYVRVLEIGCGEGHFSGHLDPSAEVWGIEPATTAAAVAAGRMHRVLCGRYDDVQGQLPGQYFDLVVCNDVIEHLPDHDAFLEEIKSKMAPGGALIVSVPNIRHVTVLRDLLLRREFEYQDAGILDRTHLRWFTAKSLRRTLEAHGFAIESFAGVNRMRLSRINFLRLFLLLLTVLSLGAYWDIWYQQFAVRARLLEGN